jgi:hypothetical protein
MDPERFDLGLAHADADRADALARSQRVGGAARGLHRQLGLGLGRLLGRRLLGRLLLWGLLGICRRGAGDAEQHEQEGEGEPTGEHSRILVELWVRRHELTLRAALALARSRASRTTSPRVASTSSPRPRHLSSKRGSSWSIAKLI